MSTLAPPRGRRASPIRLDWLSPTLALAGSILLAVAAGYVVAGGYGPTVLTLLVAGVAAAGVLLRPSHALALLVGALLANGRELTKLGVGHLYAADALLALFLVAAAVTIIARRPSLQAWRPLVPILLLVWLPAIGGLILNTTFGGFTWAANFEMVVVSLYALLPALFLSTRPDQRRLLAPVLVGSLLAFLIAILGFGGAAGATSTGAVRIAHGSFVIPFGVAALVVIAFVQERVLPRRYLLLLIPFITGLFLMNHRSSFIGFAGALVLLACSRPSVGPRLAVAVAGVIVVVLVASISVGAVSVPGLDKSVERAESITNESDPNIKYRLAFWKNVARGSLQSPLIGQGFDRYPESYVPTHSTDDEDNPQPHNSFLSLAYRIGPFAAFIVLFMIARWTAQGFVASRRAADPTMRAALGAVAAVMVFLFADAAFNVALEVPYFSVLFWLTVGLLTLLLFQARSQAQGRAPG
jgi:hypothetical protein